MSERIYNALTSLVFVVMIFFIIGCAGTPTAMGTLPLDEAINTAAYTIGEELGQVSGTDIPDGGKTPVIAILNFSSPSEWLSVHVIEELTLALAENNNLHVIERKQLDLIRQEKKIQLSGEVSDEYAVSIGKEYGATHIVTGSLREMNDVYRFSVKAIVVETARIVAPVRLDVSSHSVPRPPTPIPNQGDKVLAGFGNLVLGLGSFTMGDWGGGLTLVGGYGVAAGLMVWDISLDYNDELAGIPGAIGLGVAGATALYGFIRPFIYKPKGRIALLDVVDGVNIAIIPDTTGIQAVHLSYTFQF